MKATCILNDPRSLADHQQGRAAAWESTYDLTIGTEYFVLGAMLHERQLLFLVRGSEGPTFAPAGMFEPFRARLPAGWDFVLGPGIAAPGDALIESPLVALWGYPELAEPGYIDALLELDDDAQRVFFRRLIEAERAHAGEPTERPVEQ